MPEARRVLAVTYGGGHANIMIPTIRRMLDHGLTVTALGATTAGPQLRAAGIPTVGYRDLLEAGDSAARAHGSALLGASHDPATGIPAEESIAYLGLSYQDLVDRLGEEEARARYARDGRHAFLPLGPMRRALERFTPDLVLTTNSPKSERAALVVANEDGIPTVAIEDCLGLRQRIFPAHVPTFVATRVCALSEIATPYLVAQGTPAGAVRLTGNPAFDALASLGPHVRTAARAALGLRAGDALVLFTGQAFVDLRRLGPLFQEIRASVPAARFAVRRHPTRRSAASAAELMALSDVLVAESLPIQEALMAADVVLTVSSTTALEAILLDRPVVQLGPELDITNAALENPDDLPLYRHGAAQLANTPAEAASAVANALAPASRTALLARARPLFVPPGGAAQAITELVVALAG